jgi:hypothetical protein
VQDEGGLVPKNDFSYLQPKTRYTEDVADLIIRRLGEGLPLYKICAIDGYPNLADVRKWMKEHPEFKKEIEAMLGDQIRTLVEKEVETLKQGPQEFDTAVELNSHKHHFEKVKFFAERVLRTQYAPNITHTHEGEVATKIVVDTGIKENLEEIKKMYDFSEDELKKIEDEIVDAEYTEVKDDGAEDKGSVQSEEAPSGDPLPAKEV